MLEREDLNREGSGGDGHEHWLAMQSAYKEYRRTSAELESAHRSLDGASTIEHLGLAILDGQQRSAFEQYVEARLAFLEIRFDEMYRPPAPQGRVRLLSGGHPALQILAVILLCATAFSVVRQQIHVRDLESARDADRAALNQTREALSALAQRPAVPQVQQVQQVEQGPTAPAQNAFRATPANVQKRTTGNFSLMPSNRLKRLGPVDVSMRLVDIQHRSVRLWIVSGRAASEVKLYQNQPLWLKVAGQRQPIGFVIDRITNKRLDGHWIGSKPDKPEMNVSQLKPMLPAGP
jgi:hypothetical protein